ncbi:hypothetical protein LWM68_23230 [Niabella sp. W65]|nr:hypothetical protein [Niabella sp. W65]MCH7365429.1 hypothetical protein [Niabella sp. W65]ULT41218.1 hypothetical protein KRR40_42115 [Niabella sp. I65]
MMKPITLFILVFMIASAAVAQNNASRYRQYAGRYGGNSGICLFEDGGFMLYGYATAVFGKYIFEKDYLSFFPDQPELFEVYAHYNKALGDSTRINFAGFQEGRTFIQFNKQKPQRVFNEDANCFDAPFVYQGVQPLTSFTLSFIKESVWRDQGKGNPSWQYEVKSNYNDFIWIFNEPKREYENFSARLTAASGKPGSNCLTMAATKDMSNKYLIKKKSNNGLKFWNGKNSMMHRSTLEVLLFLPTNIITFFHSPTPELYLG